MFTWSDKRDFASVKRMSSIFDRLRGSLGMGSSSAKQPGHILGRADGQIGVKSQQKTSVGDEVFDISFTEGSLGMVLRKLDNGRPIVDEVVAGGSAESLGVRPNDLIIGVEGNVVESYEVFIDVISAFGRPVSVRFKRGRSAMAQPSASSSSMRTMFGGKSVPPPAPLSEEEKESRRLARVKAVEDRGNAWEKRIAQSSKKKLSGVDEGRPVYDHSSDQVSVETQRAMSAAKRAEEDVTRRMGYNPYQPHMSFSGTGQPSGGGAGAGGSPRSGAASSLSSSSQSNAQSNAEVENLGSTEVQIDDPEVENAVNESLGLMLSAAEADGPKVQTAVETAMKMLRNLADNRDDLRPRKIRLGNPNFHTKVVEVSGGVELFIAAGFVVVEEMAEGKSGESEPELFLQHSMEPHTEARLHYTLQRLTALQG